MSTPPILPRPTSVLTSSLGAMFQTLRGSASYALIVATAGLWFACGSTPKPAESGTPRATVDAGVATPDALAYQGPGLLFDVEPAGSVIVIDGATLDSVESDGFVAVDAGLHQLVVRKDGYNTWRAEVSVRQTVETIKVRLEPVPAP